MNRHWNVSSSPRAASKYLSRSDRSLLASSSMKSISAGSTIKPRLTAVCSEPPSPNQSRSLRKNPFGMPSRLIRVEPLCPSQRITRLTFLCSCMAPPGRVLRLFARWQRGDGPSVEKQAEQGPHKRWTTTSHKNQQESEGTDEGRG